MTGLWIQDIPILLSFISVLAVLKKTSRSKVQVVTELFWEKDIHTSNSYFLLFYVAKNRPKLRRNYNYNLKKTKGRESKGEEFMQTDGSPTSKHPRFLPVVGSSLLLLGIAVKKIPLKENFDKKK